MKAALFVLALAWSGVLCAQALEKQVRDGGAVVPLTVSERAELNDPLFRLVLRNNSDEVRLDEIVKMLKGSAGVEQFFVVDEQIIDPAQNNQSRRAVIGFTGSNQNIVLNPNVMLSVIVEPTRIRPGFIEAWGWDDGRSRYNYYKLDGNPPKWKFRASSVDADKLAPTARDGTCLACHVNGGPVMKELPFPWNNWHSFKSPRDYLSAAGPNHWPVAEGTHLAALKGAESLETDFILPSLRQFNGRRIDRLIRKTAAGTPATFLTGLQEISDGPRLLRPLFETTEYNITSSSELSGLHPIPSPGTGPTVLIPVPDTFFLNANLMAGGGAAQYQGLGVPEARQFAKILTDVSPDEYRKLVSTAAIRFGNVQGDSNFAWFVPEASHSDNHMVDALVKRGVITAQFAAAVLAVDVENPVFSRRTPGLLKFVPSTFRFKLRNNDDVPAAHPDALTRTVIANIQAAKPAPGTPEADFLAVLQSPDPVVVLRQRVRDYIARVQGALGSGAQREAELTRLFNVVVERRKAAIAHPVLQTLIESEFLFAVP